MAWYKRTTSIWIAYVLAASGVGIGAGAVAFVTTDGHWLASVTSGFFATAVLIAAKLEDDK